MVPCLCSGPAEGLGSCWSQADPRIEERPLGALAVHLGFCALGFGGCAWEEPSPAPPRVMSLSAPWTCLPCPLDFRDTGWSPTLSTCSLGCLLPHVYGEVFKSRPDASTQGQALAPDI